jgi:PIN domain nuclease of toxin-antitoxin system
VEFAAMIVLDTHAWIWWVNEDEEAGKCQWRDLVSDADHVAVSSISCFEVAWLAQHGRIKLHLPMQEWFKKASSGSGIEIQDITPQIAEMAVTLPEHHSDPQDRLIMATAIVHRAQLISADGKFAEYDALAKLLVRI